MSVKKCKTVGDETDQKEMNWDIVFIKRRQDTETGTWTGTSCSSKGDRTQKLGHELGHCVHQKETWHGSWDMNRDTVFIKRRQDMEIGTWCSPTADTTWNKMQTVLVQLKTLLLLSLTKPWWCIWSQESDVLHCLQPDCHKKSEARRRVQAEYVMLLGLKPKALSKWKRCVPKFVCEESLLFFLKQLRDKHASLWLN